MIKLSIILSKDIVNEITCSWREYCCRCWRPPYRSEFKENLIQIVKLARIRFNPDIMLLTSHPFEDQYEMDMIYNYYRIIQEVARDLGCKIIPLHAYLISLMIDAGLKISDYIQKDFRYPNELGHEIYARAISQKLI